MKKRRRISRVDDSGRRIYLTHQRFRREAFEECERIQQEEENVGVIHFNGLLTIILSIAERWNISVGEVEDLYAEDLYEVCLQRIEGLEGEIMCLYESIARASSSDQLKHVKRDFKHYRTLNLENSEELTAEEKGL